MNWTRKRYKAFLNLITTVIFAVVGIMVIFIVINALFSPTETAVTNLQGTMQNSSISLVQSIASLPGTAFGLFILFVILAIILGSIAYARLRE